MANDEENTTKILLIILFLVTIGLFCSWGYQWVNHVLSLMFDVNTGSTVYDFFIGLIAMFGSVMVFIGSMKAYNLKAGTGRFMWIGGCAFMLKNLLDMINDIQPLMSAAQATPAMVKEAASMIGADMFQFAFWAFVIWYFNRESFSRKLS